MEIRSSPALTPVSPSSLTSPPPLSSAGLSSRITSSINAVQPRLSTLLPNSSGYLSFFSRPTIPIDGDQRRKARSSSFSAYIRTLPQRVQRSFSAVISRPDQAISNVSPNTHGFKKGEKVEIRKQEKEKEQQKEFKEVEDEWKCQANLLKPDFKHGLTGARCISITNPIGDLTDEYLQSTVIISSTEDPFPNLPQLPHRSPRRRSSNELRHSNSPSISSKPNLSPIPPSPPSDPPSSARFNTGIEFVRMKVKEERKEKDYDHTDPRPRISDVRSGTASSSTKRAPTQKSIRPTLGINSSEHRGVVEIDENNENGEDSGSDTRDVGLSRNLADGSRRDHRLSPTSPSLRGIDQEIPSNDTPKLEIKCLFVNTASTWSPKPPPFLRPPAPEPPTSTAARRSSLILNPDEYEYLLSLQAIGMKNAIPPFQTPSHSPRARTETGRTNSVISSSSSSTIRPMVPGDDTLNNDTPTYSPSPISTNGMIPLSIHLNPPTINDSTYSPPPVTTIQERRVPARRVGSGRDVYREHLRRAVVQHYNDSPTPSGFKSKSNTAEDNMLTPDSDSSAYGKGNGRGLRRAWGRGIWYKKVIQ